MTGRRKALIAAVVAMMFAVGMQEAQANSLQSSSLFQGADVSAAAADPDTQSVEVGVQFSASSPGQVNAIRFLKAPHDVSKHTVSLWDKDGTRIGTGISTRESATGWQTVKLNAPVRLQKGELYLASFHTTRYMATTGYFTKPLKSGPLNAPVNAGVYGYGNQPVFPNSTWKAANYWVDVVFGTSPTAPTTTSTSTTSTSTTKAPATTTTTVKTSSFQANCITKPSLCGYPDETNTGVPNGVVLKQSGSVTVTQDGAVVENLDIKGQIDIKANNVTIRNTRITSGDYYPINYDGYKGLLVEDSQIIGTNTDVTAGISFNNYTARRVDISGTVDGFKADANVVVEDCYVHGLSYDPVRDTHNDGLQTTGGSNVTLHHNTFKLGGLDGISSVVQIGTEWGKNSNWLVTNNLMDGGGWSINAGPGNTEMTFTNNRFTKRAGYGVGDVPGSTWTGNYFDEDGKPA